MLRLVCLLACLWLPAIGNAADRVALVIGNSDYKALPDLTHAQDDASAIAGVLRDIGYDVFNRIKGRTKLREVSTYSKL